jgi:hypothetical protein
MLSKIYKVLQISIGFNAEPNQRRFMRIRILVRLLRHKKLNF